MSTACVSILLNMLALQRVIMTAPSTPTGKCSAEIEHEACCMYHVCKETGGVQMRLYWICELDAGSEHDA